MTLTERELMIAVHCELIALDLNDPNEAEAIRFDTAKQLGWSEEDTRKFLLEVSRDLRDYHNDQVNFIFNLMKASAKEGFD